MKLKIFMISQNANTGYDTYDSVIVIVETDEEAKRIHPSSTWKEGGFYDEEKKEFWTLYSGSKESYKFEDDKYGTWTNDLTKIKVEYLGEAKEGSEKGVVVASFNAG